MDEVRIVQLWHIYGLEQIKIFANMAIRRMKSFYDLHPFFTALTNTDMVYHYLSFNRLRPNRRICGQNTHVQVLQRWGKFLELQRMFPGWGPVTRVGHGRRFMHLVITIGNMIAHDAGHRRSLKLLSHVAEVRQTGKPEAITRKDRKLLKSLFESPLRKFLKAQKDFGRAAKIFNDKSIASENVVDHMPRKLIKKVKKPGTETDKSVKSKKSKDKKKTKTTLGRSLSSITIFVPIGNSFLHRFRFFTRMRVPFIPVNTEIPTLSCRNTWRSIMKPFLVLNEDKFLYCDGILRKLREYDIAGTMRSFEVFKASLVSLLELKKSLYCSICDATQQPLFDLNRGVVVYSQEFCYDLLVQFREYIFFKNIDFVDFVDTLMQVQECAQSTGDENTFPSINRFTWMKRRIPFIHRCYQNLEKPDFYMYCRFMCVQYRLQDYSNFFEGDSKAMSQVYSAMISFVRSRGDRTVHANEPHELNVPKQSLNITESDEANLDDEEQQMAVHVENRTDFSFSEQFIKAEIFEKINKPVNVGTLRSMYSVNVHGLNPISIYRLIDFRVQIEDILLEQQKRTEGETLEVLALEGYFDAKIDMIGAFNRDVDLRFNEVLNRPAKFKNSKDKKKKNAVKPKLQSGISEKPKSEEKKIDVPDWNEDFSEPDQPDVVSSWFNYIFHRK